MNYFPIIILTAVFFMSCSNRETGEFNASYSYQYFPLQIGKSVTYAVDSIVFDTDGSGGFVADTTSFFVKEILADTFRDATGNLAYRVERFERPNETENWNLSRVWSAQRIDNQSIRTEENLRYLKLIHPVDRRSEWDGLVYIDHEQLIEIAGEPLDLFKGWFTEVDTIDKQKLVGNFVFDSTLVLREADYDDKVDRRFSKEIYAKNIGLVYKEQQLLHSKCADEGDLAPCANKPWEEIAGKGFILRQVVIDYQ